MGVEPVSVRLCVCPQTGISPQAGGPIAIKFYLKHHWGGGKATLDVGPDCIRTLVSMATGTVMTLSFRTERSGQTVQTQIRLLLEEQSDQGLHCLLFHLHLLDKISYGLASSFEF